MALYNTGDTAPETQDYYWVKYMDGTTEPEPTEDEKTIPLEAGETFPPVKSEEKWAVRSDNKSLT